MKSLLSLRYMYKIESKRLSDKKVNWDLTLPRKEAIQNEEMISLASSNLIRMIDELNGGVFSEEKVSELKRRIASTKKMKNNVQSRRELIALNKELQDLLFMEDYLCLVVNNNKDYDRAVKGFKVNGIEYVRLIATSGGVKKSTIIFCSKRLHDQLYKKINNGRNMDKAFVPAKLEAYLSLVCSASIPVSKPNGVLVIKDCETHFKSDVIELDDSVEGYPKMTEIDDYDIKLSANDGFGLMLPTIAERWNRELEEDYIPSGFCLRNAFCKGMLFTFDFVDFAEKHNTGYMVCDIWGQEHDVRDVEIVLTESMLKLWDSYDNIDHYLACCDENGFTFAITKSTPEELDSVQTLNYQFIQSLELDDEDIYALCKPTIDEIKDVMGMDYRKTLLFLKGVDMNEKNFFSGGYDYSKALMIEPELIKDPHVQHRVKSLLARRINDAKIGVLEVQGNFAVASGDPYLLCESMFGLEPKGLLKAGEFYHKFWLDRGVQQVAGFRAPMSNHNNIQLMKIMDTEEMQYWYQYMPTVAIVNAWDTTCHKLNGMDFDGDTVMTTDNPYILKGIKPTKALVCLQKNADKMIPTEKDFIKANKNSFGDDIGSVTNRVTSMYSVLARFPEDSPEWTELDYRIKCGQNYQQNAIDKAKGIISKPMPKEWYAYSPNKITDEDSPEVVEQKEFNLRIMADKKPYFFNYVYPSLMKDYKSYLKKEQARCIRLHGKTIEELRCKSYKTEEEEEFLRYYDLLLPSDISPCIMNKITWIIENEFEAYGKFLRSVNGDFDHNILKGEDPTYSKTTYKRVGELYNTYLEKVKKFEGNLAKIKMTRDERNKTRELFMETFVQEANELCANEQELCNIVLDLCYTKEGSKKFAWDICGKTIIDNLLKKHQGRVVYPEMNEDGDIEFKGFKFKMVERTVEVDNA